jgi:DUF2971 family protein
VGGGRYAEAAKITQRRREEGGWIYWVPRLAFRGAVGLTILCISKDPTAPKTANRGTRPTQMPKDDPDFEQHIQERTVKPPAVLYKYVPADDARKILSNCTLRFQSPLQYNDPFDTQWNIAWPLFTQEAMEYDRLLMERAIRDPGSWPKNISQISRVALYQDWKRIQGLPENQHEKEISDFVYGTTAKSGMPKEQVEYLKDLQRRMRLLCLSENDRSVLMWSHYADQHRGVVLGFDTIAMEKGLQRPLYPIKYHSDLPRLIDHKSWNQSIAFGLPNPGLGGREIEWAVSKHSDWAYEKEWRFVTIAGPGTPGVYEDFAIPHGALVEFVSGCRSDKKLSVELLSLARNFAPDIQHYRMKEHPSRFELNKSEVNA